MHQTNLSNIDTESNDQPTAGTTDRTTTAREDVVSDETIDAAVCAPGPGAETFDVPVEIGDFTHREVPNRHSTTWKRIWGAGETGDFPYIATIVTVTSETTEHWKVSRAHYLYREATGSTSSWPARSGTAKASQKLLKSETLSDDLPARETAVELAKNVMVAASAIDPLVPPAMGEKLATGYCRERHPEHPLASRTVKNSNKVAERTDLDCDDPIKQRLKVIEDVYETPITLADSFVEAESDTGEETEGDTGLLDAFSWMESWESRGFDVEARMPATREIIVRHSEAGEKFKILEVNDAKRGSVFKLGATINGEYIEQYGRDKMRDSFGVALRDLSRLMRAEIGDARYYHR